MIVAKQKLTKKKIITYIAVIAALIIGNIIIYLRNSQTNVVADDYLVDLTNMSTETPEPTSSGTAGLSNQSILDNKLFGILKKIGDWPVTPQNVGKSDPFAPFFSSQ